MLRAKRQRVVDMAGDDPEDPAVVTLQREVDIIKRELADVEKSEWRPRPWLTGTVGTVFLDPLHPAPGLGFRLRIDLDTHMLVLPSLAQFNTLTLLSAKHAR